MFAPIARTHFWEGCRPLSSLFKNPWDSQKIMPLVIEITEEKCLIRLKGSTEVGYCLAAHILLNESRVSLSSITHENKLIIPSDKKYEILFIYRPADHEIKIKLPYEMNKNLLEYLTGGRREKECCMDFVSALYFGCGTFEVNRFLNDGERSYPITDSSTLQTGQAISIGDTANGAYTHRHLAIYLGEELFLSVMGNNIPILITTLEQMKLLYGLTTFAICPMLTIPENAVISKTMKAS